MFERVEEAIQRIRDHAPDVLVVSGDLIDAPFYGMNDAETVEKVEKDLRRLRERIDRVGCPVFYLFGNHDHRGAFETVFDDQTFDATIGGFRFLTFNDEEVHDNTAERLGADRERFNQALSGDDPTPQIHLQHYMVWPINNEGYPHAYREAAELKQLICDSGRVRLSLSGHYHRGADAAEIDGTWFATARAFCQAPHPYRIYDLAGDTVQQTEYTLECAPVGRALIVDLEHLASTLTDQAALTTLVNARRSGWPVCALVDTGSNRDERSIDHLSGALEAAGCHLEAVIHPRGRDLARTLEQAIETLGLDPDDSFVLSTSRDTADAARASGLRVDAASPDNLSAVLERLAG